jgi:hypothetical protein
VSLADEIKVKKMSENGVVVDNADPVIKKVNIK